MSARASVVHKSEVTVTMPYGATIDTSQGGRDLAVAMPLTGARDVFYALKDLLESEGVLDRME